MYPEPGAKVGVLLCAIAPNSSSLAWVVVAVEPDEGEALFPAAVLTLSAGVVADTPENSLALAVVTPLKLG